MSQKTIWKYPVPIADNFILEMPRSADILCVQMHRGRPRLWALVDPSAPTEERTFSVVGTGNPADHVRHEPEFYIGTFQVEVLVWHLFELPVIELSEIEK